MKRSLIFMDTKEAIASRKVVDEKEDRRVLSARIEGNQTTLMDLLEVEASGVDGKSSPKQTKNFFLAIQNSSNPPNK